MLFFITWGYGQSKAFEISGTLISEEDSIPLEAATVYLERIKDSTLVTYTIADKNGFFLLENKSHDKQLKLSISYVGYQTYSKIIALDKSKINLNTINMQVDGHALNEVVIRSTAPITIKKDTLEFNVSSFKTKKDANVEDLLKELPGVEIDEEGNIKVNGKDVDKIFVNGKPFFGDDPTITTRNLTKDIIQKIQILDTKSKDQAFTGETVDGESKTVNLVIKEEHNKGVFGRVAAGAGTDNRYEFAGMFNKFNNNQRISVLAGGNNVNSPGFSFGEIRKMFGGSIDSRSFGGGQGITESKNIGANYADEFGKGKEFSANYFYSGSNSENQSTRKRENILPDSRYFTDLKSNSYSDNENHSMNLEYDIKVDPTLLIHIKPSAKYSKNQTVFSQHENSKNEMDVVTNESTSNSNVETIAKSIDNDINVTKRFGSRGAFLKFRIRNSFNTRERHDFLNSETHVYGDNPETISRNQQTEEQKEVSNFNSNLVYRLPLVGNVFFVDLKYDYNRNKQEDIKSTFDKDSIAHSYTLFNTDLSTAFEYVNETSKPSVKLEFRNEKLSTSVEAKYVSRTLESKDNLRPMFNLSRDFNAMELRYRLRYKFSSKESFGLGYSLNSDAPGLTQLQAFKNVSNPLNTVVGNPNLNPEKNHRVYMRYNAYDFQKGSGFYGYLNAYFEEDKVVSKSTINKALVKQTTYTNVNGSYRYNGYIAYSKKVAVDSLRTIQFNIGMGPGLNRTVNFSNTIQYASKNVSITPSASMRFIWKDVMEFNPRYRLAFNKTSYDIERFENKKFINHSLNLNTATFLPKGFEWRNNIQFNHNPNIAPGFQKSAWFWNATLAYAVLKEQGMVSLKAYDLLNQSTNAIRVATDNYIQDSQSTVLQQYFMLSFSWKFNSLGKAGETRGGRSYAL
ncbi:outer membrane beta-barrel protein [Mariniflexile ostreae]|uniref:Outer membrane beta-barrel protein n=1 Tax=Mariniflexile ostreae TaxID=1520892 RepID=A0ABV5FAL0_9FLAO